MLAGDMSIVIPRKIIPTSSIWEFEIYNKPELLLKSNILDKSEISNTEGHAPIFNINPYFQKC